MMVDGEKSRKADEWLARVVRFSLGKVFSGTEPLYPTATRVQPTHYTSYLHRKVSSAVLGLENLVLQWGDGRESRGAPGTLVPGAAAQVSPGDSSLPADTSGCVINSRKRSASEASLDERQSHSQPRPPSSSLQQGPRASDDGGTPSGPASAAVTSQMESGGDRGADSAGPQQWCSTSVALFWRNRPPSASAAVLSGHEGLAPCRRGLPLPRQSCGGCGAQQQPPHQLVPAATGAFENLASHASQAAVSCPRLLSSTQNPGGVHRPLRAAQQGRVGSVASKDAVARSEQQRLASLDESNTRAQAEREVGKRDIAEVAALSVGVDLQGLARPAAQMVTYCELPAPACTLQQLVLRQEVAVDLSSRHVGRQAAMPGVHDQLLQQRRPLEQAGAYYEQQFAHHGASTRDDRDSAGSLGLVLHGDLRVRAATEATAAASAGYWHQQLQALPVMDVPLKRWPLCSLADQLAISDQRHGPGARSSCGGASTTSGHHGAEAGTPSLRHVCTPLPRQCIRAKLDLNRLEAPIASGCLAVESLAVPMEPDVCPGRADLWDLLHLNLPFVLRPGDGIDAARQVQLEGTAGFDGHRPSSVVGDASGISTCSCNCGGGGHPQEKAAEHNGDPAPGSCDDDADVYISDEGLACLASLSQVGPGLGGWRLPFLVRPRTPPDAGDAHGSVPCAALTATGCSCRCCSDAEGCCCRGRGPRQGQGQQSSLYFAEPLPEAPGLLLSSWSRICARALTAIHTDGVGAVKNAAATPEEDCACCQHDEWQLGELSLLVLSHCSLGMAGTSASGRCKPLAPVHVVALAHVPGPDDSAARQRALRIAVAEVALRYPELACRTELRASGATTMVVVVNPTDGSILAQQCMDLKALQQCSATTGGPKQDHWRLVHDLLAVLRQLPAGPYMLRLDAAAQCLEILGS